MILYKNRLFFGIIKTIIRAVFGVVNKILSFLNLQPTLLLILLGIVLYFTGTFDKSPAFTIVYELLIVVSVVYAVIATIKKLLGLDKKVKKSKGAQIVNSENAKEENKDQQETKIEPEIKEQSKDVEKPIYFRVKQNSEYVMAEYKDRFELYKIIDGQLKKVRTDYKNGETV